MSWISKGIKKIGKSVKKLVTKPGDWLQNMGKDVGKAADFAGDYVKYIPGVGQLAAPALEMGGSVLQGNNMKEHGMAALSSVPIPGLSKIPGLKRLGGFASKLIPDSIEGAVTSGIKKIGGMSATDLLAGAEGVRGAHDLYQQYKMRNKAVGSAEGAYNERAPLRRLGVEGMMSEVRPDLASLYDDPGNVYSQPSRAAGIRRIGGY